MQVKKSKKADLERKGGMFFQMGFVIALGASLVAFEWKTSDKEMSDLAIGNEAVEELELPPITMVKEPEVEKPLPKKIPVQEIIIAEDDVEIKEDLDFSSESTEEAEVALDNFDMEEEENQDPLPFYSLSEKPEYPGGESALMKYLGTSVKYPVIAQENGIQGTVYVSFVISKTGKVKDVAILRGVDASLNKEAIRVVTAMQNWKPGKQGTKTVDVSYQVPIRFLLR